VEAITARLLAAGQQLAKARGDVADLATVIADLDEQMSRLSRGEIVPTPDAVAAARAARDRVWRVMRRMQEEGPVPAGDGEDGLPAGHLPDVFETLRDQADELADRRADEAQRVADFLSATDRLGLARRRREAAAAALAAAEETAARAEAAWRALWAQSSVEPLAPPAMAEWCRARAEVLRIGEAVAAARRQFNDLAVRRDLAQNGLAAVLPDVLPQQTLGALLLRAKAACIVEEAKVTEYGMRKQALADTEDRLPELQQSMAAAATALEVWQREWSTAVAALGLPADATIDTTEAALAAWARIAEAAPSWRTDEGRIAAMNASIEAFTGGLHAVLARLDEAVADEPVSVIAARFGGRLAEARKAAADADELTKQIIVHRQAATDATNIRTDAEKDLETLCRIAGVTDNPALERAIERARQRDAVTGTIAHAEQALVTLGDRMAEARDAAERHARLHVARVLLRAGIDRFHKEKQGPLLRAAGRHFALLTGGRYERLIVDYDAAGRTVLLAIRDIGTECPVEALSEGARDQLYLALRIAAVEAYAAQAEPLPFIADDLLVHFDDTRAAAAIALLAELGHTTQVILFTHHDHIVALAERQAGVAVQALPPITVGPSTALAVA
jgi:chromosome segregation protein